MSSFETVQFYFNVTLKTLFSLYVINYFTVLYYYSSVSTVDFLTENSTLVQF